MPNPVQLAQEVLSLTRSRLLVTLPTLLLIAVLAGCATSAVMPKGVLAGTFGLGAQAVDEVIVAAISRGWPDAKVKPLGGDRIGYQVTIWRLADADNLVVEAFPQQDLRYAIRVHNLRYLSEPTDPAREKLVRLIVEQARLRSSQPG